MKSLCLFVIALLCLCCSCSNDSAKAESKEDDSSDESVVGWVENVKIIPGRFILKAKLDTGAKTSSVHTKNYKMFQKGSETWVRFEVLSKKGRTYKLECPVIRSAKIKEHDGSFQERPVIELSIVLGNKTVDAEVNLVDRSNFIYPLLLGRSYLKASGYSIDPTQKYTKKVPNKTE